MTTLLLPNDELVCLGWLATIPGFTPAMVGTTVPRMPSSGPMPAWVASGFLAAAVVGGSPDPYMPQGAPVLEVNAWCVNATQAGGPSGPVNVATKPPWGKAQQLAQQVWQASYLLNRSGASRQVAMPVAGYAHAAVQSAVVLSTPRRMPSDFASYARYTFDLQLFWFAEAS